MIMMAAASALFLPLLVKGSVLGHPVSGYVFGVGVSVIVGAFLFGIGMQLGDGCASGTLYHIGGGRCERHRDAHRVHRWLRHCDDPL